MSATGVRRVLLAGTAALVSIGSAHAQTATTGTTAGTTITNTAQASYTVNGTPQTATSNAATFVVDRKVNLSIVAAQPGNTSVSLGQQGAYVAFRVTNNTNGIQDFLLSQDQTLGFGILQADNFDVTDVTIHVDSNNNGVYDPGVDQLDYIDELAPDASRVVFLVANVPNVSTQALAGITLNAQVAEGGLAGTKGVALQATLGVNSDTTVDVVFADNDSDGLGPDGIRNGQARASLAYEITERNVALTVTKSSLVLSDPVNFLISPKALPGATVQYCLTVQNATPLVAANNVQLSDVIPANTTYVPGSLTVGGIGGAGVCLINGASMNDDGSAVPLSVYTGSYNATTKTVTANIPQVNGASSVAAAFRVTIN